MKTTKLGNIQTKLLRMRNNFSSGIRTYRASKLLQSRQGPGSGGILGISAKIYLFVSLLQIMLCTYWQNKGLGIWRPIMRI